MDILLVIFQLVVVQAAADQFYESNNTSTWEDANRKCSMVTPGIDVTSYGHSVHIDYNLTHAVWIGYFKMLTVFEYIGCAVVDSQHRNQAMNLTRQYNSPGLCYSKCKGKEIIGVSLDKCICLGSVKINDLDLQCNMSCATESGSFLCGGQGHISIYRVKKNEIAGTETGQCLSFEYYPYRQTFSWNNSYVYHPALCENGNKMDIKVGEQNGPWKITVQKCFQEGFRPISYQALRQIHWSVAPSWSGIISSDVIYTSKEWSSSYTGVRFGYMRANKTVDFTDQNDMMFELCNRSTTEHTTSTSLHTSRADNTSSIPAVSTTVSSVTDATVAAKSSTADIPTTTSRVSSVRTTSGQDAGDSDTRQNKQSITMSPGVGVIAGVSVTAVLLVAALIVVFVFLRRRRKLPDLCSKFAKTTKSENTDQSIPAYAVVKTSKAQERMHNNASDKIVDSNYAYTYFVLEPQSSNSETYDISGHEKQKTKKNDTVYNTLNSETSTTYDHAYNRKKDFVSENDYDTAEKAAMKLKAGVETLPEDYAEIDNDTYNHINNKTADGGNTDNTYNVPNQYNCSGYAEKTSDKEDYEEVDTYSHINGKPVNSFKPDNVYGTPDIKNVSSI